MRRFVSAGLALSAIVLSLGLSNSASAQLTTDVFNVGNGGSIASSSSTITGFEAIGIIGGATAGEGGAGNTIFTGTGPNFVNISTTNFVVLTGVNLFTRSDSSTEAATASRGTFTFSFLADTDNNGTFETSLVNNVNPLDTGAANFYTFSAVTANSFQAVFTGNAAAPFTGPRVVELDAVGGVAAPEPGSALLLVPGLLGLVGVVRRRRK